MIRIVLAVLLAAAPVRAQDGLSLTGTFAQGNVVFGRTEPGAEVRIDGRLVRVSQSGSFVIGIAHDRTGRIAVRADLPHGRHAMRSPAITFRTFPIQRLTGVRDVDPSSREEQDFQRELAERVVGESAVPYFEHGFDWPVRGAITSPFGAIRMFGAQTQRHFGVDIAAPLGTPVRAPADGVVVFDRVGPIFGRTLVIDHGHGLTSSLLHLSRVRVAWGTRVHRGDVVAESGASGRVTGPHLDWRLQLFGVPLDPLSALPSTR